MRRIDNVFWSWVVVAALLVAVASPVAMPGRSIERWATICTSSGAIAATDAGDAPSLPEPPHLFGHCPMCSLHGGLAGLPPQAGHALALLPLAFAMPRLVLAATPTANSWLPAQPRGPPLRA